LREDKSPDECTFESLYEVMDWIEKIDRMLRDKDLGFWVLL
jgi:hypothetical protein